MNSRRQLEDLYAGGVDPWDYANDPYERAKYAATLDILPTGRYGSGLEIGCSEGVFTRAAAARVDRMLGVDVSDTAVVRARAACAGLANVEVRPFDFIHDDLDERFAVIFCSEVLYYVPPWRRSRVARKIAGWLEPNGLLILVHTWREHTRTWDDIYGEGGAERLHRYFTHVIGLPVLNRQATDDYEILLLRRAPSPLPIRWRRVEAARLGMLAAAPTARSLVRNLPRELPLVRRTLLSFRDDTGRVND